MVGFRTKKVKVYTKALLTIFHSGIFKRHFKFLLRFVQKPCAGVRTRILGTIRYILPLGHAGICRISNSSEVHI